ncbi:Eukaryotic peptide chain release factor GTP-binding subunit [Phytophthora nicotianae]|uniref:Eukaryotic peptide chain release factor GTP-binding subunit n=1 Tax=Phytophthora nicotianae TaxID=4792 RepID=A0A0W8D9J7_PHYNI|nr:Eukaryotic peptide chain release factor GTP-binding subunit [Phytophthora nicotianae]
MTIDNKRSLIRQSREAPGMTQTQLAEWAQQAFRLAKAPARNTVSDILKNGEIIMKGEYGKGKRRKPLKVKAPALEKRLEEWVTRAEKCGMCLNRKVIRRKAQRLRYEIGGPALDLGLSVSWLSAFLKRHELRYRARHGEAGSADHDKVREGRHALHELTDMYAPQDTYNMDETGLNYKAAPTRSICSSRMPGVKKDKTRITLALTTNADGSDTLPAFKELWESTSAATIAHCWQKAGLLAPIRGVEEYDATDADNREQDDSDVEVIDLLLKIAAIEL